MTTNHPAHGPVSLDRLHQIHEILSKAAAQSDGGNLGYAMADAVKVIDGAIAAFGAEPVAINDDMAYAFHHALSDSSLGSDEIDEIKTGLRAAFANVTAPPAPVYQYREIGGGVWDVCGKDWFDHCSQSPEHDTRTLYAAKQPAPIVPDINELEALLEWILALPVPTYNATHFSRRLGKVIENCRVVMIQPGTLTNEDTIRAGNSPVTPDGWVPVSDRMPPQGVPLLVCSGNGVVQRTVYGFDGENWIDWYEQYDPVKAELDDLWQPLPAAPKQ